MPADVIEISAVARAAAGRGAARDDEFFQALETAEQLVEESEASSEEEMAEKLQARNRLYAHLTLVEVSEDIRAERFDRLV